MNDKLSKVGLVTHGPINPFIGKIFKKVTYDKHHKEIKSEVVTIESQIELKTTLDEIKQFNSDITVTNLDGTGKPANGRSLMKVVALGVKKGHRLRFTAQGADAEQALKAIGDAIAAGLGEGA